MSRLPLALFAVIVLGCRDDTTSPTGALDVTLALSRNTVAATDSVTVLIAATNPTNFPVTFRGSPGCFLTFLVNGVGGEPHGAAPLVCLAVLENISIDAGQTATITIPWALATNEGPLAAGSYQLVGGLRVAGQRGLNPVSAPALLIITP